MDARHDLAARAARLRTQVSQGLYGEALDALEEYGHAVRSAATALQPDDPAVQGLAETSLRLIDELSRRAQAGRARLAASLDRLPASPPEACAPPASGHTWQIMG